MPASQLHIITTTATTMAHDVRILASRKLGPEPVPRHKGIPVKRNTRDRLLRGGSRLPRSLSSDA